MIPVVVTAERAGRWWWRRVMTWRRELPERWSDLPEPRRRLYYGFMLTGEQAGLRQVLRHCLRLPAWAFQAMRAEEVAALAGVLAWMQPAADCDTIPFPSFEWRKLTYHFPKPTGENLTCIEYPLADEYYLQFVQDGNDSALLLLLATICREECYDRHRVMREEDYRVPLHSRAEVIARANRLRGAPVEYQMSALLWYAGMKQYVHRVYGPHLFDLDDEDDNDETTTDDNDETPDNDPNDETTNDDSAGFGWWGVLQDVAEAGLFGTMKEVYQASFHEVCMWLVRQRIKERQMSAMYKAPAAAKQNFD